MSDAEGAVPTPQADVSARLVAALERITAARRGLLQEVATRHRLSVLQVEIVRQLSAASRPVRTTDLATELAVTLPTVSDALGALRRKAVVEQHPGRDARSKNIVLTESGRTLAGHIEEDLLPFQRAAAVAGPSGLTAALSIIRGLWMQGVLSVDRSCVTCRHHVAGPTPAGHCDLLGVDLTPDTLQIDCPEHEVA